MQTTTQIKQSSDEKLLSMMSEMVARIEGLEEEISDLRHTVEQMNNGNL